MGGPKVMRVPTRCRDVDEFVAAYASMVDEESIIVMTDQPRQLGARHRFTVELADGSFVLRGEAEVIESSRETGRLRLRLLALDAESRAVHRQMVGRGAASAQRSVVKIPPVPKRLLPTTRVHAGDLGAPPPMPEAPARKQTTRMYGLTPPATPSPGPRSGRPSGRR